jgi:hypothetical protein
VLQLGRRPIESSSACAVKANPHASLRINVKNYGAIGYMWTFVCWIVAEIPKGDTIESTKSDACGYPQVAILVLFDGHHIGGWQPILHREQLKLRGFRHGRQRAPRYE